MSINRKILIYNDSPVCGGHEVMTANLANVLGKVSETYFLGYSEDILSRISDSVYKIKIPFSSKFPWASIRSFNLLDLWRLFLLVKKIDPSIIIVSQGSIELSLRCVIVCKILNKGFVSYIPYAFSFSEIGVFLGKVRDYLNRILFILPSFYITINERQKYQISIKNIKSNVFVLPNFIQLLDSKKRLMFSKKRHILKIGIIGNINFKTKGQDKVIPFIKILKKKGIQFKILIIGNGKDEEKLKSYLKRENLTQYIEFKGWISNKEEMYEYIDLVVLLSNFDVFPLVALESLFFDKPVFIPCNIDIVDDFSKNDFIYCSIKNLAKKIVEYKINNKKYRKNLLVLKAFLLNKYSEKNFKDRLFKIIRREMAYE